MLKNARFEAFCLAYIKTRDEQDAYKKVYPGCKSDEAARTAGGRLLRNPKVKERIKELVSCAAVIYSEKVGEAVITAASLIAQAEDMMQRAARANQYAPAATFFQSKCKLAGFLIDKSADVRVTNNFAAFIDAPPRESYEQWVARRARELAAGDGGRDRRALEPPARSATRRHPGDMG